MCVCVCVCGYVLIFFEVFRTNIYMRHYGSLSWKPTCLWSNSWHIQKLDLGPLTKDQKASAESLAKSYIDRHGVKQCVGKKKKLKESQSFGWTTLDGYANTRNNYPNTKKNIDGCWESKEIYFKSLLVFCF